MTITASRSTPATANLRPFPKPPVAYLIAAVAAAVVASAVGMRACLP